MKTLTIFATTFLLVLVASALPAVAGTVNMQFIAAGGNSYNGVSSYPYFSTVNGTPFNAMCISFNEHITNGETWQAAVYTVDGYGALIGNTQKADELAWLFLGAKANGGSNSGYNAAAWAVAVTAFCLGIFIGAENTTQGKFKVPFPSDHHLSFSAQSPDGSADAWAPSSQQVLRGWG